MARKHRDDDEDIDRDDVEADDVEADEDEPLADEEEAPDDEPADDAPDKEEPAADVERADEEDEDYERPPRPRTPILALVLVFLNLLTVPIFLVLLLGDYSARQQWTYDTFLNRLAVLGLPLAEEENGASVWYYSRPRLRIDGDKLKEAYMKRPRGGAPSVSDQFQPVDTVEEALSYRIRPSQIDARVKADLFRVNGLSEPVATIDEEAARLKRTVPPAIQEAATKYVEGKTAADKKKIAEQFLLPLAWTTKQVEQLQERINRANTDAELELLAKEGVERRLLTDLLAPVNVYDPGDMTKYPVEKVADLDTYKIEELRKLLVKRFDQAVAPRNIGAVHRGEAYEGKERDDIQKRHAVAFLMVAISQLRTPDGKEQLFPKSVERAEVVNGLYEFTQAAANYPRTLVVLEKRVLDTLVADRDGYYVEARKVFTESGFGDQLSTVIARLKKEKAGIAFTDSRIKELEKQRDRYLATYKERLGLLQDVTRKLVEAKVETARLRAELNEKQREMFISQRYLATAGDKNSKLEASIVATEKQLLPKRGETLMMNFIGKGLVILYTGMCLFALCLATVIYFEFVDWGRAEPRSVRGEAPKQGPPLNDLRIASEFDKSVVLYNSAVAGRDLVMKALTSKESSQQPWHVAEARMAQNHLFYVATLDRLRKGEGDIEVNALADVTATDTPGKAFGKPVPNVKVAGLTKSLASYRELLKMEQLKLEPLEEEVRAWAKKDGEISYALTGKDVTGKKVQHGLFELVDDEFNTQQRLLAETDYLEPLWAAVQEEARRYESRRASLEDTLSGLDKALKAKKAREK